MLMEEKSLQQQGGASTRQENVPEPGNRATQCIRFEKSRCRMNLDVGTSISRARISKELQSNSQHGEC